MDNAAILIIALSARPFVHAAKQAGFKVTAIDGFADVHTSALAEYIITVPFDEHGFNAGKLIEAINQLDASRYKGFVFGSGFDAQPELLQKVAHYIPLIGNSVATVGAVKSGDVFFKALQALNIAHPQVFKAFDAIPHTGQLLKKSAGGCGGTHISIASLNDELSANQYFQQYIQGCSVSLLFLANAHSIEVVGFNEQWLNSTIDMPFRYGGAVSNINLPQAIQLQLINAAEKLTLEFGLVGLNSLDAVIEGEVAYVLEVNPRLSATFDLYEVDLFNRHLQASVKQMSFSRSVSRNVQSAKAHTIVYALEDVMISLLFDWPDWVTDIPAHQHSAISIQRGEPICTVLARADDADTAKQLVLARVKMLLDMFKENT
ncbi:MAG: ATP-grasp domain-containing protein [Methylophilaceae bacterium]|nr:ATP-grasp domain-containing protein [Methylotenera sp.]